MDNLIGNAKIAGTSNNILTIELNKNDHYMIIGNAD